MPEISRFYGIIVRMFYGDHPPPHFHAAYQGDDVEIEIGTLASRRGKMARRAMALVLEWAAMHRDELQTAWELASRNEEPPRIEPLD